MHVAFSANRRCVAEAGRDACDGGAHIPFRMRRTVEALDLPQRQRRQDGSRPGAKILGGDVLSGDLPEIRVHIGRGDILLRAVVIDILQELLAGQLLAGLDDLGDAAVLDRERPLLAALADETEADLRSVDRHVAVLERREPVTLVLLGVVIVSNANQRRLQKMHDGRKDFFPQKPAQRHVLANLCPHRRQGIGEADQRARTWCSRARRESADDSGIACGLWHRGRSPECVRRRTGRSTRRPGRRNG